MSRERFVLALGVMATLLLPGRARGQELELLDSGKPVSGVPVIALLDDGKPVELGRTGREGILSFDPDVLDFAVGETIAVWVRRCEDGEVALILVREGRDDPCAAEDAQAGEDCGCEKIVAFIWRSGKVVIDIGTRTVGYAPLSMVRAAPRGFAWYFGAAYDAKILREVTFRGVASDLTVDQTVASGGSAYFGVALGPYVRAGIRGGIANVDREASLNGVRGTFDYHEYELGPRARIFLPVDRFDLFFIGMVYYMWNKGDFPPGGLAVASRAPLAPGGLQASAAQQEQERVHRVHKSWRYDLGGGATYWFAPRWGLDTEVVYSPKVKGEDDADEHVRISIGLVYNGGAICGGQCGGRR